MKATNISKDRALLALNISLFLLSVPLHIILFDIYSQNNSNIDNNVIWMVLVKLKNRILPAIALLMILLIGSVICWANFHRSRILCKNFEQLAQAEKLANFRADNVKKFLSHIAHEIRTPLHSVLGYGQLLSRQSLAGKSADFVLGIEKSGSYLLEIVDELLDTGKIQQGIISLKKKPFSIVSLLQSLQEMFTKALSSKELHFKVDIDENLPENLIGDETRLKQILINLIGNAIKFTEYGGIWIYLSAKYLPDTVELHVQVRDSGIGIEESRHPYIFEEFQQGSHCIQQRYGGAGLGLYLVKQLVTLQNGSIEFNSLPGRGTTFNFYIPYELPPKMQASLPEIASAMPVKKKHILIVEDNPIAQSLMQYILQDWSLTHDTVSEAATAFKMLQQKSYDLVLLDINLPDMDGYQAAKLIRDRLGYANPIVAMTAGTVGQEKQYWLKSGINAFLMKPLDLQTMGDLLCKLFGRDISHLPKVLFPNVGSSGIHHNFRTINLQYMVHVSDGDLEYQIRVSREFLKLVPSAMLKISQLISTKQYEQVSPLAHGLRSSMNIMGLSPLANPLLDIFEYGNNHIAFSQVLDELETITRTALAEVNFLYKNLTNQNISAPPKPFCGIFSNTLIENSTHFTEGRYNSVEKKRSA